MLGKSTKNTNAQNKQTERMWRKKVNSIGFVATIYIFPISNPMHLNMIEEFDIVYRIDYFANN